MDSLLQIWRSFNGYPYQREYVEPFPTKPIPPNTTNNSGSVTLHYLFLDSEIYLKVLEVSTCKQVPKLSKFKRLFYSKKYKYKYELEKKLNKSPSTFINIIDRVESIRKYLKQIVYVNKLLDQISPDELVYIYKWSFDLHLPPSWKEYTHDISSVTTSKKKLRLFNSYTTQYHRLLHDAQEFRAEFYDELITYRDVNNFDIDFLLNFEDLFINYLGLQTAHFNFVNSLNFRERKRYRKLQSVSDPKQPTVNVTFDWDLIKGCNCTQV